MGPGKRATAVERAHMGRCKTRVCIPCLLRVMAKVMPATWAVVGHDGTGSLFFGLLDYHHAKSGNLRRGHLFGWAMCKWHHERIPPDGWTHEQAQNRWGTSLKDGSRLFRETYGDDDSLIEAQAFVLEHGHAF